MFMKQIFLLSVFCVHLSFSVFSQEREEPKITSLKKSLPHLQGVAKIDAMNSVCDEYFNLGFFGERDLRVDSIYLYATAAHNEAVKINYSKGVAEALLMLGFTEMSKFKYASAEKYITEAISLKNTDLNFLGKAYGFLGAISYEGFKKAEAGAN